MMMQPTVHEQSSEKKMTRGSPLGFSALRVRYARAYARGTRTTRVVKKEIYMGVVVSPAPRITPESDWVTAKAI